MTSRFSFSTVLRRAAGLGLVVALAFLGACQAKEEAAPAAPAAESVSPDGAVTVRITDKAIELSQAKVRAGEVTFRILNAGTQPHGFKLKGTGLELGNIQPGNTSSVAVQLHPGGYDIVSIGGEAVNGAEEPGLEARLQVIEATQ
jgi:hypothetical protein